MPLHNRKKKKQKKLQEDTCNHQSFYFDCEPDTNFEELIALKTVLVFPVGYKLLCKH